MLFVDSMDASDLSRAQARRGRGIHVASLILLSSVACCGAQGEHVAETFLVEPPNWLRTDNWRPPASPGTTFYWHDRSWAPECPWDIGRLTKKTLEAPACTFTFGCSIPGCTSQCLANMFQRVEDDFQPESPYQLTTVPDGPLLPVGEAPARFPVARSAFAVDAYRCPLLAATIYNLAAANNMSLPSSQGLDAPGLACPSSADIDLVAPFLSAHAASLQPIPAEFNSTVDNAIWPFTYRPNFKAGLLGNPGFGSLAFAGTAEEAKDIVGRYCKTEVVGAALQEVIYNALPEYQQGLLYDPVAGPNAQARVVCRDSEAILDSIPQSSELAVVQGVYEAGVQATEGAQCYGHLAQYLDPSQLPWQDRLTRAPEALTAWQPAATAWRALHDYCRAITTEDACKDAHMPELQRAAVASMLAYQTAVAGNSSWNDPYQATFSRPPPPMPPPSSPLDVSGIAVAPEADDTYDDAFLSGEMNLSTAPGDDQTRSPSSTPASLQKINFPTLVAFTAAMAAFVG